MEVGWCVSVCRFVCLGGRYVQISTPVLACAADTGAHPAVISFLMTPTQLLSGIPLPTPSGLQDKADTISRAGPDSSKVIFQERRGTQGNQCMPLPSPQNWFRNGHVTQRRPMIYKGVLAGSFRARGPELLQVACSQPETEASSQRERTPACRRAVRAFTKPCLASASLLS